MLSIKEIQERLKRNPEPKEVKEIRENIINTFNKLEFIEEGHKYFLPQDDGSKIELKSVSNTCHQFIPYTDWDMVANRKALKEGLDVDELKRTWFENNHLATNSGTGVHLYGEMCMHFAMGNIDKICDIIKPQYEEGYLFPHSPKEMAVLKYWEDLNKIDEIYPVMPEMRVYMGVNDKFKLKNPFAGTLDILLAIKHKGSWKLILHDYKTNSNIYKLYNQENHICLNPPFDDMIYEDKSVYTLQLSCYELALRQLGYDIIDRKLIWVKDDGTYEKVKLPSLSDKLASIL